MKKSLVEVQSLVAQSLVEEQQVVDADNQHSHTENQSFSDATVVSCEQFETKSIVKHQQTAKTTSSIEEQQPAVAMRLIENQTVSKQSFVEEQALVEKQTGIGKYFVEEQIMGADKSVKEQSISSNKFDVTKAILLPANLEEQEPMEDIDETISSGGVCEEQQMDVDEATSVVNNVIASSVNPTLLVEEQDSQDAMYMHNRQAGVSNKGDYCTTIKEKLSEMSAEEIAECLEEKVISEDKCHDNIVPQETAKQSSFNTQTKLPVDNNEQIAPLRFSDSEEEEEECQQTLPILDPEKAHDSGKNEPELVPSIKFSSSSDEDSVESTKSFGKVKASNAETTSSTSAPQTEIIEKLMFSDTEDELESNGTTKMSNPVELRTEKVKFSSTVSKEEIKPLIFPEFEESFVDSSVNKHMVKWTQMKSNTAVPPICEITQDSESTEIPTSDLNTFSGFLKDSAVSTGQSEEELNFSVTSQKSTSELAVEMSTFTTMASQPSITMTTPEPTIVATSISTEVDTLKLATDDTPKTTTVNIPKSIAMDIFKPTTEGTLKPTTEDALKLTAEDTPKLPAVDALKPTAKNISISTAEDTPKPSAEEDALRPTAKDTLKPTTKDTLEVTTEDTLKPTAEDALKSTAEDSIIATTVDTPKPTAVGTPRSKIILAKETTPTRRITRRSGTPLRETSKSESLVHQAVSSTDNDVVASIGKISSRSKTPTREIKKRQGTPSKDATPVRRSTRSSFLTPSKEDTFNKMSSIREGTPERTETVSMDTTIRSPGRKRRLSEISSGVIEPPAMFADEIPVIRTPTRRSSRRLGGGLDSPMPLLAQDIRSHKKFPMHDAFSEVIEKAKESLEDGVLDASQPDLSEEKFHDDVSVLYTPIPSPPRRTSKRFSATESVPAAATPSVRRSSRHSVTPSKLKTSQLDTSDKPISSVQSEGTNQRITPRKILTEDTEISTTPSVSRRGRRRSSVSGSTSIKAESLESKKETPVRKTRRTSITTLDPLDAIEEVQEVEENNLEENAASLTPLQLIMNRNRKSRRLSAVPALDSISEDFEQKQSPLTPKYSRTQASESTTSSLSEDTPATQINLLCSKEILPAQSASSIVVETVTKEDDANDTSLRSSKRITRRGIKSESSISSTSPAISQSTTMSTKKIRSKSKLKNVNEESSCSDSEALVELSPLTSEAVYDSTTKMAETTNARSVTRRRSRYSTSSVTEPGLRKTVLSKTLPAQDFDESPILQKGRKSKISAAAPDSSVIRVPSGLESEQSGSEIEENEEERHQLGSDKGRDSDDSTSSNKQEILVDDKLQSDNSNSEEAAKAKGRFWIFLIFIYTFCIATLSGTAVKIPLTGISTNRKTYLKITFSLQI